MADSQSLPIDVAFDRRASRARAFEQSPWSEATELLRGRPDSIYFGNGSPAREAQPVERLQEAAKRAWMDAAGNLDYGELEGYAPLRELVVERMRHRGIMTDIDTVMVTNGSQQGIDLIAKLMLDAGDPILVEGPTYIGAMQTFDAYQASYVSVPMDSDGIDVDNLEAQLVSSGIRPKLLYTIPTFQNPTGYALAEHRRGKLIELSHRFGFLIVEDDPYGEIYFGKPPAPALRALDPGVIYLGTFSKTIAPGLRVGWMVTPARMLDLLLMAKEGTDINSNRLAMRTIYYAAKGFLDGHVNVIREIYRKRRDILIDSLAESTPPAVKWCVPQGGFFVWAELPNALSGNDLLRMAAEFDVGFLPGSWFYPVSGVGFNAFRLSYSALPIEKIGEGGKRLGEATTAFLERS